MIVRMLGALFLALFCTQALAGSCDLLEDFASNGILPELDKQQPECSASRVLGGGRSQDCFWSFDFRSSTARAHYALLSEHLRTCSEGQVMINEKSVNHPDSFEQITGVLNGVELSLSLKDKSGLGRTLIFLRRVLD